MPQPSNELQHASCAGHRRSQHLTVSRHRTIATTAVALLLLILVGGACSTDSTSTGGDRGGTESSEHRRGGAPAESTTTAASATSRSAPATRSTLDSSTSAGVQANATVERVVDGDTIVAEIAGTRERIRLIGIDTPESVKPRSPVECFGKEASAHTNELLPAGTPVRLVLDVEERDRYDRLLAYVYRASDGLFVNLALAADGYAGLLTYPPNVAHVDEFRAAVTKARQDGLGLWASCSGDLPVKS